MNNLDQLIATFNPRRTFKCSHTTIEVDGILVRVGAEDEKSTWVPGYEKGNSVPAYYSIDVEDILQDPAQIRSARVSTGRDSLVVNEKAQGLINFLWRDRHPTPSEGGIVFRLKVNCPIAYAHPFFRLFASHNELSGRYGKIDGDYYTPQFEDPIWEQEFKDAEAEAQNLYSEFCEIGLATEMARLAHLYRFYTRFYITISLRHILEFLTLDAATLTRHSSTEFWQIREVLANIVESWTPWAWQAFVKTPRISRFKWTEEVRRGQYNDVRHVLRRNTIGLLDDIGSISFIDKSGIESVILNCLDDFPDPAKAFNHGSMTFFARMPIHVFRQWVRHRHGVITEPTQLFDLIVRDSMFYVPKQFRKQEGKVGAYTYSDMDADTNGVVRQKLLQHINNARQRYRRLRGAGMSEEMASMILPFCFYYDFVATYPLGGLFNLLSLRTDSHAQWETQQYAKAIWPWLQREFPQCSSIFAEHLYYGNWIEITNMRGS